MVHRWDPVAPAPRGLVRPVRVDPAGLVGPTPGQARGPLWRRTTRGYAVPAHVDGALPEQRIMEQAERVTSSGAVTGWASLRLHGAAFLDGLGPDGRTSLRVPLVEGSRRLRSTAGAEVLRAPLDEAEVVLRHGVRCVRPERAVVDAVRGALDPHAAVVVVDMACAGETTTLARIAAHSTRAGVRSRRLAAALQLASEASRSPAESRLRLAWVLDAGWPAPLVNREIRAPGGTLLGVADLLDAGAGVVGEYDGAEHRSTARHGADVRKDEALRGAGLEVVRFVRGEPQRPRLVADRLESARERVRARRAAGCREDWVLGAPGPSLDHRLDARGERWRTP